MATHPNALAQQLLKSKKASKEILADIFCDKFFMADKDTFKRRKGVYKLHRKFKAHNQRTDIHIRIPLSYSVYILTDEPNAEGFYKLVALHNKHTHKSHKIGEGTYSRIIRIYKTILFNPKTRKIQLDANHDAKTALRIKLLVEAKMDSAGQLTRIGKQELKVESTAEKAMNISHHQAVFFKQSKNYKIYGRSLKTVGKQVQPIQILGEFDLSDVISGKQQMSMELRLQLLINIATQLKKLHSLKPSIIHLDIKPYNIRVDSRGNAYLIDFDLSKTAKNKTSPVGTASYVDPCLLADGIPKPYNDIFSFGRVVAETLSLNGSIVSKKVYSSFYSYRTLNRHYFTTMHCLPLVTLIKMMTGKRNESRPSIDTIIDVLSKEYNKAKSATDSFKRKEIFIDDLKAPLEKNKLFIETMKSERNYHASLIAMQIARRIKNKKITFNNLNRLVKHAVLDYKSSPETKVLKTTLSKLRDKCVAYQDAIQKKIGDYNWSVMPRGVSLQYVHENKFSNEAISFKLKGIEKISKNHELNILVEKYNAIGRLKKITEHDEHSTSTSLLEKITGFEKNILSKKTSSVLNQHRDTGFLHFLKAVAAILTFGIFSKARTGSFKFWKTKSSQLIDDSNEMIDNALAKSPAPANP